MLNETLDRTMAQAREHEILTKASKFSNVFKNITQDRSFQEEIMHAKLDKYIKQGVDTSSAIKEVLYDTSSYIVENPNEVIIDVQFGNASGLPFFKSLYNKLFVEEEIEVSENNEAAEISNSAEIEEIAQAA